jgi:phosphoglucosamine mutase
MKKLGKLTNNCVITTEWSNIGLQKYLEDNDFHYYQSNVGERYVIDLMKKHNASLGGEIVGHIVLSEYAKTGDALATAIVLSLAYLDDGRKMDEIFPIFKPYPHIEEKIRFSKKELMEQVTDFDDVKKAISNATKTLNNKGRLLVRKSGTEPVLKLRAEGQELSLIKSIIEDLKNIIMKYQK